MRRRIKFNAWFNYLTDKARIKKLEWRSQGGVAENTICEDSRGPLRVRFCSPQACCRFGNACTGSSDTRPNVNSYRVEHG